MSTKLSANMTVERYLKLLEADERKLLAKFIFDRFDERYFSPLEAIPSVSKHGFTTMAMCCLVIETIESFYEGLPDTGRGQTGKVFARFFNRKTSLNVFEGKNNWFYTDIRCGILHQSETKNGWKIWRRGLLLDEEAKTINATLFSRELRIIVSNYSEEIINNEELWNNFVKKMKVVCENCA